MAYTVQSDHPVPVVDVLVFNDRGDMLLTRRDVEPFRGQWIVVGGRIDAQDDCAESAAVREAKEETGLDVELTHLVGVGTSTKDPRFFVSQVVYAARIAGGALTVTPEASEFRWASVADALKDDLAFNHHDLVAMYAARKDKLVPTPRSRYDEYYGRIFPFMQNEYPRFACVAAILNKKNEVLLARRARKPFVGAWDLPGGHLYVDETLEECLRREVREELGVACVPGELFHVYSDKGQNPKNADVAAVFFAKIQNERFLKNVEMDDFGYFPLDRLPAMAYKNDMILADVRQKIG